MDQVKGQGIQSVEQAHMILKKISEVNTPLTITEISNLCDIKKSALNKYIVSFCRIGYLEKNKELRYTLGTELVLLGLRATTWIDLQEKAEPFLELLNNLLNETVCLNIWGEDGPLVTKWKESQKSINIGFKVGSQFEITRSSTGKLFVAFLPEDRTRKKVENELQSNQVRKDDFLKEIELIRNSGYSFTEGHLYGITSVSAPVFNHEGEIIATITIVGVQGVIDTSPNSTLTIELKKAAVDVSKRMGYREPNKSRN